MPPERSYSDAAHVYSSEPTSSRTRDQGTGTRAFSLRFETGRSPKRLRAERLSMCVLSPVSLGGFFTWQDSTQQFIYKIPARESCCHL